MYGELHGDRLSLLRVEVDNGLVVVFSTRIAATSAGLAVVFSTRIPAAIGVAVVGAIVAATVGRYNEKKDDYRGEDCQDKEVDHRFREILKIG